MDKTGEELQRQLDELKQKKLEIEQKIRELNNCEISYGLARIGKEHYPTLKPDRWYLGFRVRNKRDDLGGMHKAQFRSVVNGLTLKDVVEEIPGLIHDLQTLYDEAVKKLDE